MPAQEHPYAAPGEDSHWGALSRTPVSARGSPAQMPRFGAARAVMQAMGPFTGGLRILSRCPALEHWGRPLSAPAIVLATDGAKPERRDAIPMRGISLMTKSYD